MAFRKISYLIPSCDGCGLAWSFYDPACAEGIPPHFASRAAALAQLEQDYGRQIVRLPLAGPLVACRRCAAAGVIPATLGRRWLLAVAGWVRRFVPFGPVLRRMPAGIVAGHPESMEAVLPPEQEGLLAEIDADLFPDQ
jgi:hypothetical protein